MVMGTGLVIATEKIIKERRTEVKSSGRDPETQSSKVSETNLRDTHAIFLVKLNIITC